MEILKQFYLSVFLIFFRIGHNSWSPIVNSAKGVAGVTLVQIALLAAMACWVQYFNDASSSRIPMPVFYLISAVLAWVNYHLLVTRGDGVRYEKEFQTFPTRKKASALFSGIGIFLFCFGLLVFSAIIVRQHSLR